MLQGFRSTILHFIDAPALKGRDALEVIEDGLLVVSNGKMLALGDFATLHTRFPCDMPIVDYRSYMLMPGFIDAHIHFPQVDVVASYADQLLPWLTEYTFPAEQRCADDAYVEEILNFFFHQLLSNGTTSAVVFGSVHASSARCFFRQAQQRKLRMIAGKCLMDRHCPDYLRDATAEQGVNETVDLIHAWHGKDRLEVAITPRFAPTSTEPQLILAGSLAKAYPSVRVQTHVAENKEEVEWVKQLFPQHRSYLDVYASYGLLTQYAVYAHGIYLDKPDLSLMAEMGASIAVSPTSNLFLGSGLFNFEAAWGAGVATPLASDIGAGTSYSMFKTMQAAYYAAKIHRHVMTPLDLFYWATLGSARSLGWDQYVGSFKLECEADFIVINPHSTSVLSRRIQHAETWEDKLFALAMLADDRAIHATYILGDRVV